MFVTDDEKEDWWWTVESQGTKRIGPRPELVEEIMRCAGVSVFYMYNTEHFVEWSNKYLEIEVPNSSIEQIRDTRRAVQAVVTPFKPRAMQNAEVAIVNWLANEYQEAVIQMLSEDFADILVVHKDGRRVGYGLITPPDAEILPVIVPRKLILAQMGMDRVELEEFWLIVVGAEPSDLERVRHSVRRKHGTVLLSKIGFVVGSLASDEKGIARFVPRAITPPDVEEMNGGEQAI